MFRFAPSPTGDMHIGNLRVALFNYILSRQKKEKFIIRIEDTDKNRNIEGKDKEIIEILKLFGLKFDKVVYQSKNIVHHHYFAYKLIEEKKAFVCFCTKEELLKEKEMAKEKKIPYRYSGKCELLTLDEVAKRNSPFSIRIKKPAKDITFKDIIKGEMRFSPKEVDSFVLLREDKTPTYNFACAIDDMIYDIGFIVRGEDHLSNTPKQIHIHKALGYLKEIVYCHLPIILNTDGKKMSKREKASSVRWLLEAGYLPSAIANYLILLGNQVPKEIFTLEEAGLWFDITKISKSNAKFDLGKLNFINKAHIKKLDNLKLSKILNYNDEKIGTLAKIYLEEANTINQLKQKIDAIFSKKRDFGEFLPQAKKIKMALKDMEPENEFSVFKKTLSQKTGLKGKNLFKPLRILLTSAAKGPELGKIYPLLKDYLKKEMLW